MTQLADNPEDRTTTFSTIGPPALSNVTEAFTNPISTMNIEEIGLLLRNNAGMAAPNVIQVRQYYSANRTQWFQATDPAAIAQVGTEIQLTINRAAYFFPVEAGAVSGLYLFRSMRMNVGSIAAHFTRFGILLSNAPNVADVLQVTIELQSNRF